ncbi:hypothetical protein [Nocardia africana]|uniref:hypothetical protein n=1 Tax=Nocardia africana TaxID=134964 RepID=UPI000FE23E73|nr:hypothetical protein [Nocardia africana]MCC3311547.1 hypothetical protein [Nocardia africana]
MAGSGAVLAPAVGVGSAPPPVLSSAVTIPLSTATGIGTAPAPNIGEVVLTLSPALGSGSAPAPSVGGGAAVTLSAAAGVGRAPTPSVAAGVTIALAPATGSGSAPAPDFASGITVTDDFNRADGGLGANWTTIGANAPVIASNRAQAGTPGIGQTLAYIARHNTALTTDTQEVVFVPIAATVGPTPAQGAGAFLRSTSAGNFVCVSVTDTQAFINTYISGTFTNRATSGTISAPTSVRFTAVGNVYSVYINGSATAAVTWTDSGALIGIGSSNRYFGLFSNAVYSFSGGNRGYAIDSIIARDGVTS